MSLQCSICKAPVLRKDCHRNRYDEYICRSCQDAGIRFSWRKRLRYQLGKASLSLWVLFTVTAVLLLGSWMFELVRLLRPEKLLTG
jgi:hypothetical protein